MKINITEIPLPPKNNSYYYTVEKSMYGGFVVYIELESDLTSNGTLVDPTTSQHWKRIPIIDFDRNQLELNFKD
jgi:hypothetical protein